MTNELITPAKRAWYRPPIALDFTVRFPYSLRSLTMQQIPMFVASNLHVRYLKVYEKSNYHTVKWVRYMTKAGTYQFRI